MTVSFKNFPSAYQNFKTTLCSKLMNGDPRTWLTSKPFILFVVNSVSNEQCYSFHLFVDFPNDLMPNGLHSQVK